MLLRSLLYNHRHMKDTFFQHYLDLQRYVGWSSEDADRVRAAAALLQTYLSTLVDDFYSEIERHPDARRVIRGGGEQVERLKTTLHVWLTELLAGTYDASYVSRRRRVGLRHVEIGLDQVYTNTAMSRLRSGLTAALLGVWPHGQAELNQTVVSLNKLIDLDLAIIEDAYQAEHARRLQESERAAQIAERQRLELARDRSEAAFGTLVSAAPCMIVILRPDRTIAYVSPFGEELTGYLAEELLGREFCQVFLPEEYRPEFMEHVEDALQGKSIQGYEHKLSCKNHSLKWMLSNARLLSDYEGGPAVMSVGQDITGLTHAQEQALQSARLAAIGQMMTGLAHESGNALARSQACLEMLALEVEELPEALDLIQRIQNAQQHLQHLYEEVRGYAAPLKLEREAWNLSTIWRQAWQNLSFRQQGKEATLVEHLPAQVDLECEVDQFRLEQVFRNIMDNSLAACKPPVQVDITCRDTTLDDRPAVEVVVRDNGPGLSPEQHSRIFDPFYTTKTKGTGLGMAITERIVKAHGGEISVGPNADPGAQIIVVLPRTA